MPFNLSHLEHVFLLAAFLITKGDCSKTFTRKNLMLYSSLFGWGTNYQKSLKKLRDQGFFKTHSFPPSNSLFYTITPKTLEYFQSLDNLQ